VSKLTPAILSEINQVVVEAGLFCESKRKRKEEKKTGHPLKLFMGEYVI